MRALIWCRSLHLLRWCRSFLLGLLDGRILLWRWVVASGDLLGRRENLLLDLLVVAPLMLAPLVWRRLSFPGILHLDEVVGSVATVDVATEANLARVGDAIGVDSHHVQMKSDAFAPKLPILSADTDGVSEHTAHLVIALADGPMADLEPHLQLPDRLHGDLELAPFALEHGPALEGCGAAPSRKPLSELADLSYARIYLPRRGDRWYGITRARWIWYGWAWHNVLLGWY